MMETEKDSMVAECVLSEAAQTKMTNEEKIDALLALESLEGEDRDDVEENALHFDDCAELFHWLFIEDSNTEDDSWLINRLCELKSEDLLAHGDDVKRCLVDEHVNTYRMQDGSYVYLGW